MELALADGVWQPFEEPPAGGATIGAPRSTSVVGVIGLGLGGVLDAIEAAAPGAHVVALELTRDMAALAASQARARAWVAKGRLTVSWGPEYDALEQVRAVLATADPDAAVVVQPLLARRCAELVDHARSRFRQRVFEARANEEARRANAGRYLLNTLRNLPAIAREGDVAALAALLSDAPAVVVAAGPSLDGSLDDLAAVAGRAVVIAVDTALKPLLAAGIVPNLVVALDPTAENARHLYDVPLLPGTFLVAEASVSPAILRSFRGRTFLMSLGFDPWPWIAAAGVSRGRLRAWGSVATTAYDLALVLGCRTIGLVGFDCGFTGGRPYCRNTEYEHDWSDSAAWGESLQTIWKNWPRRWRAVVARDAAGAPVVTAPHLVAFRNWLAKDIQRVAGTHRIVNGGGGILVGPTIQHCRLDAVLPHGFDASRVAGIIGATHRAPGAAGGLERARRKITAAVEGGEAVPALASWIAFAPTVTTDEVRAALSAESPAAPRIGPGPHVRPEQAALVRRVLEGSSHARAHAAADVDHVLALLDRALNDAPSCARGFSPRLREGTDDGCTVPASALIDWHGDGYAAVRRLEAALGDRLQPESEAAASVTAHTAAPRIQPVERPGGASRNGVATAARIALLRQTALTLLDPTDRAFESMAAVLRAIDPVHAQGNLRCRIRLGAAAAAEAALDSARLGHYVTGRAIEGAQSPCLDVATPVVHLALGRNDGERDLPPSVRLLCAHRVLPYRVLASDAFPGALWGCTFDAHGALLNPRSGSASVVVEEDGTFERQAPWPRIILGELAWSGGGRVAWHNDPADPVLMHRDPDGAVTIERPPFVPNRALEWEDGRFVVVGSEGVWLWRPGSAPERVCEAPPAHTLTRIDGGVRIDLLVKGPEGFTARAPLDYALVWRSGARALERLPLGPEGPCWSVSRGREWTAAAHPHADIVRLTHASGRVVDLGCYYPVTVAWAGASLLVVSATSGRVLVFERLTTHLEVERC
jgi:hypothetical protein